MLPLIQRLHHGFPETTTISMQSSHFIVSEFPISEGFVEYHLEQKHLAIIWLKSDPKVKPKHQHLFVSKREGRPTNYGCVRRRPLAFAAVLIGGALCWFNGLYKSQKSKRGRSSESKWMRVLISEGHHQDSGDKAKSSSKERWEGGWRCWHFHVLLRAAQAVPKMSGK